MAAIYDRMLRDGPFVARQAAVAASAYVLARWLGMQHPEWAVITGVIVSQDQLAQTRTVTVDRMLGSFLGVAIAIAVSTVIALLGGDSAVQVACAVAIAASVARRHPSLRICMWTCPIVILTSRPNIPVYWAGLWRGSEIAVGGAVGIAIHVAYDLAMLAWTRSPRLRIHRRLR